MKSTKRKASPKHHEDNAKAVISLLILLVAFSILAVFYVYKDNIIVTDTFKPFMALSVLGMGLLVGLLYLVGNSSSKR